MTKPELDLGIEVIKYTFDRLPAQAKIKVIEELERETWAQRLDTVVRRLRSQARKAKVTNQDIDKICEEVKREYDAKHRRH